MEEADNGLNIKLEPIEIKEDIEILDDDEVRDPCFKPKSNEPAINEIGNTEDCTKDKPSKGKPKRDKRTSFNCKFCPFTASTLSPYRTHLKKHRVNAKVAPKEDEKESMHYTTILDGEVKVYKCTICGRTTKERYLIRRHVWVHTGQFPMTCVFCKAKIRLKKSMRFHLKKEHNLDVRIRDIESDGKLRGDIKEYQKESVGNNHPKVTLEKLDTSTVTEECSNSIEVKPSEFNDTASTDNTKKLPTGDDRYITIKNGRFFQCVVCHKNWQTKSGFNTHFASHMEKLPYSCEICGHKGATKKVIKNHMRRAHKVHISTYDIPDMASELESEGEDDTVNSMMEIMGVPYTTIEGNPAVKCKVCSRIFDGKHQFGWHFTRHKKDFPFSCDVCPYRSRDENYLKSHMETWHRKNIHILGNNSDHSNGSKFEGDGYIATETSNGVIYKCLLCEKELKHRGRFNLHFVGHEEEFPYSCKQCPYRAREKSYLKQHSETRHNVEIELENIEADNFDNNESSRYIVVRSGSRKLFKCRICGELKSRIQTFNNHYLLHPQGGLFSCNLCDYKATERRFLKQHLQIKHDIIVEAENIRRIRSLGGKAAMDSLRTETFPCTLCGETFHSQYHFKKHQLIHSGDRPYLCPHCTYKSKTKYILKTHLFRRHKIRLGVADIHPTKTSVGSEAIVKQEFQVADANPIQTQASSKMLKCESCHFTCTVPATLTKHRNRVHNLTENLDDRFYFCPHCTYKGKSKYLLKSHLSGRHKIHLSIADIHPTKTSVEPEAIIIKKSLGNELVPVINQNIYKCEQCSYISVTKQEFLEHGESHLADDKRSIDGCTLDSPEYVTVKKELPGNSNDVSI